MKTIEEIIHRDDWKRDAGSSYTEQEIKTMLRRYGEECVGELWENIRSYLEDGSWYRAHERYIQIEKEIAKQVII